jgi:hypothetical protein
MRDKPSYLVVITKDAFVGVITEILQEFALINPEFY